MWPAPGMTRQLGAGDGAVHLLAERPAASARPRRRRRSASGQWIVASSGVESGRVISASSAPAIASAEFASDQRAHAARPPRAARAASSRRAASASSRRRRPPGPLSRTSCSMRFRPSTPSGVSACGCVSARTSRAKVARRVPQHRERDVAAHRQAADHRRLDVQRVEQIDDVAGVVVDRRAPADRRRRRRSRAAAARSRASRSRRARAAAPTCGD